MTYTYVAKQLMHTNDNNNNNNNNNNNTRIILMYICWAYLHRCGTYKDVKSLSIFELKSQNYLKTSVVPIANIHLLPHN